MPEELFDNPEAEETEEISVLRKGYGRFKVIDKNNFIIFTYDYITKKTEVEKVKAYLIEKYKDCTIVEVKWTV